MHREAWQFVRGAVQALDVQGARVLEIGSRNVNGSVRPLFAGCAAYVGIDVRDGPGVDFVSSAEDYDGKGAFDICVSTETMEHMKAPQALIECAKRALKTGGILILTAAGPSRAPHGIDGGDVGREPYKNIEPARLRAWLDGWQDVSVIEQGDDVYAVARKPK